MKTTNEIVGYRAYHHAARQYLHHDARSGRNYLEYAEPATIGRGDCHRRIAAFLDQTGEEANDDFSIDPVFRQMTPMETASEELTGLLSSLAARHGLVLNMSKDEMAAKIAKELRELGATNANVGEVAAQFGR
jgi:hypothetical protein